MTASDVITVARDMVQDAVQDNNGNYRWAESKILRYIGLGEREIARKHPEAQYIDKVENPEISDPATSAAVLGISATFKMPLCHYVAACLLNEDADDEGNLKLAAGHYELFTAEMA